MTEEENGVVLPEDIEVNDETLAKADKRPELPPGITAMFRSIEVTKGVSKKAQDLQLVFDFIPLRDHTDGESGIAKYKKRVYLTLPIANKEMPGHEPPPYAYDICERMFRALLGSEGANGLPGIPDRVGWNKATRRAMINGEVVSQEEANEYKKGIKTALAAALRETWKNPGLLKDLCAYATTETDKKTGQYVNLNRFEATEPRDPLSDLSDF